MDGLSLKTWQLGQVVFPQQAEIAGRILAEQYGTDLPFCKDNDEYQLERSRFAALKSSQGNLDKLQKAVEMAKRDWRDEPTWAGFAERLTAHGEWAVEILGQK